MVPVPEDTEFEEMDFEDAPLAISGLHGQAAFAAYPRNLLRWKGSVLFHQFLHFLEEDTQALRLELHLQNRVSICALQSVEAMGRRRR